MVLIINEHPLPTMRKQIDRELLYQKARAQMLANKYRSVTARLELVLDNYDEIFLGEYEEWLAFTQELRHG